jgi:hypothetical protein
MKAGPGTPLEHLPFMQRWVRYLEEYKHVKRNWEGQVEYTGFRPVEVVNVCWDEPRDVAYNRVPVARGLARMRNPFMRADAMIQWSDLFIGEDGLARRFEDFNEGEMIRHQHENRDTVENQASAVVFNGCFFCHVCQKTYYVLSKLELDPYPFDETETRRVDCVKAFLPRLDSVDWGELLSRKYLVVSAPMGTGKTSWLKYLLNKGRFSDASRTSACVLTHRSLLALQIAKKCGLVYYLERLKRPLTAAEVTRLNKWTLQDEARLVVVVNSLWRVGEGAGYKVLIVDEAGLVRRHFVGATLAGGTKAAEAYDMVKRLVGRADKVLLLQEGLERGDVGFYTGMQGVDPEDRRYVKGYNFEKPIRVHDIEFSEDLYNILGPMLDRYTEMAKKADSEERGGEASESDSDSVSDSDRSDRRSEISQIEAPFLVLTSSLAFAEVLFGMLSECAATDERRGRIRLMMSRQWVQPQDDFELKFGEEPDE